MKSRLGISVATAFNPDLLLIDEVLGVGDASFREKSKKRVRKMIEKSGAVVIVSHSLGLLTEICDRIIVLEHGKIIFQGNPNEGVENYKKSLKM